MTALHPARTGRHARPAVVERAAPPASAQRTTAPAVVERTAPPAPPAVPPPSGGRRARRAAEPPRTGPRVAAVGPARLTASFPDDGAPAPFARHVAVHGPAPRVGADLVDAIEAAGIRGRGGAGFPLARKVRTVLRARSATRSVRAPVVVLNGAESDSAGIKDRALLRAAPHLVLDGAQALAAAVGAREVVVWLHPGRAVEEALAAALAERPADAARVRVVVSPRSYVAGESSAVVQGVGGGPAVPRFSLVHTAARGVGRAPTLLSNVETAADVALLARYGPDWYRATGTAAEPGTVLLTVRVTGGAPVLVEAPLGAPLAAAVRAAGGPTEAPGAVLIGGYGGAWLPGGLAPRVPLSHEGTAALADELGYAATLGSGIVAVLPQRTCLLAEVAAVVRYLAAQSARQCGPCANGLPALAGAVEALLAGTDTTERVFELAGLVAGRGACTHPDGAARFAASALHVAPEEVDAHLRGGCGRPHLGVLPVPAGAAP